MAKKFVGTFSGAMDIAEVNWLNEKLKENGWNQTIQQLNGVPSEEYLDDKGKKRLRPCGFWYKYIEMKRAQDAIWREICGETENDNEREELYAARWKGLLG